MSDHGDNYRRTPDPGWFDAVVVGSVLQERGGPFRIVREVSRCANGCLRAVSLVIRRRSWTGRAYTILSANDLKTRRFTMVPNVRVKTPKTLLDVRIAQAINQRGGRPFIVTADEVVGLP